MKLSSELISQFVKVTNDEPKKKTETTVYATAKSGSSVKIDGSDRVIPVKSLTTVKMEDGDRVTVKIKDHTAVVTGNLTDPSAKGSIVDTTVPKVDNLVLNALTLNDLDAEEGRIGKLLVNHLTVDDLDAEEGRIGKLLAGFISAEELDVERGRIEKLETGVADIDALIFDGAAGDTIHTNFSNSVIAQLGDAQIKSAMIESIVTNDVEIKSNDGKLLISDETIQIKDTNRVRVQIGKDEANDYSINIWDQNGNLMFSKGGITDAAIKDAIIRDDMVAENANIASSKVYLDEEGKTLKAAFKDLKTTVSSQGETITSHGAIIEANQEAISTKVWQQDINTAKSELSTQYSTLQQDVNGFKTTVSETYTTTTDLNVLIENQFKVTETLIQQTAEDLTVLIDSSAKTATNYLNFSSGGLVVGDFTSDTLGKNILIDSDSVDIRSGTSVRASFGEDLICLAKHNTSAKIDLCNSKALLYHEVDNKGYSVFNIDTTYGLSYIKMSAPMHDLLVLENTNNTNGVIIKGMINGQTVGGFGLVRDGYMVRYGADADDDNPVEHVVLDTGNYLDKTDSGWQYTGGYGENFVQYNNDEITMPKYRKIGRIVEMRGVVRPTKVIAGSTTHYEIFTLKEGYRPSGYIYQNCRGNYTNDWLLTIAPSGRVSFSRYGNGTTYLEVDTSTWLPFQITFFTD